MKRAIINSGLNAALKKSKNLVLSFILLFVLQFFTAFSVDAQRRGGYARLGNERIGYPRRTIIEPRVGIYLRPAFFPFWGSYYSFWPYLSMSFIYGGLDYYFYNGIYFRDINGRYAMVPAPIGYRVKTLPKGYEELSMDSVTYFYYYGSFYVSKGRKYEVVPAPVGAMVQSIPKEFQKVVINGGNYYIGNGVQYKAVLKDNTVWYKVIKSGGTVTSHPSKVDNNQTAPENKKYE